MAVIYAVWKGLNMTGGYIGKAVNGNSSTCDRIYDHIISIGSSKVDSCGTFIQEHGIGGCRYGYWDESEDFGVGEEWKGFKTAMGITSDDEKLNFAEIMHILGNKTDLSQTNKAIGGGGLELNFLQTPGIKALLESTYYKKTKKYVAKTTLGKVSFTDYSDLFNYRNIEQKFFWPQIYAASRIISYVTPWYVILNLKLGKIIEGFLKGTLDKNSFTKSLKDDLESVSSKLVNLYNNAVSDISTCINIQTLQENIFLNQWVERFADSLWKRFAWFNNNKQFKDIKDLIKGFSKNFRGSQEFIHIVNIPRQNILNALAKQTNGKVPSWYRTISGIPTNRYAEGNDISIRKGAQYLFNKAWKATAVANKKPTLALMWRMNNWYRETYQFQPNSSVMMFWSQFYRRMATLGNTQGFTESYNDEGELDFVESNAAGRFVYQKPERETWWYEDYLGYQGLTLEQIPMWCL